MKENLLWLRRFDTVEDLRRALHAFKDQYNRSWILHRHGYRTPAQVRADQVTVAVAAWCKRNVSNPWTATYATISEKPLHPCGHSLIIQIILSDTEVENMHTSSTWHMADCAKRHLPSKGIVLDVGSFARDPALKPPYRQIFENFGWTYVGLDVRVGPNVDIVTRDPFDW